MLVTDATPMPTRKSLTRRLAELGEIPAEALSTREREALVRKLHGLGWTDVEIATHTRMTTYTTGRIRSRLGLAAHPTKRGAAA